MKHLYEAIDCAAPNPGAAASVKKHLKASGITGWDGLTRSALYDLRNELRASVAPNTAKTVAANFASILTRYEDEVELPKGWRDVLRLKGDKPLKAFLSPGEIAAFEKVETRGGVERYTKSCFLVSCWSGMRISDAKRITEENISDGILSYVSEKTGVLAVIPAKPGLWEHIQVVQSYGKDMYLSTYNNALQRLMRRAGIRSKVKIHKAGRTETVEKWKAMTSHSGRISIATCLSVAGASLNDIKSVLGHTSTAMSERYIVPTQAKLSSKALKFFE